MGTAIFMQSHFVRNEQKTYFDQKIKTILSKERKNVQYRVELLPIIYRLTGKLILPFYRQIVTGKNGNDGKRENESTIIIL
jgi:hypothetical protein